MKFVWRKFFDFENRIFFLQHTTERKGNEIKTKFFLFFYPIDNIYLLKLNTYLQYFTIKLQYLNVNIHEV